MARRRPPLLFPFPSYPLGLRFRAPSLFLSSAGIFFLIFFQRDSDPMERGKFDPKCEGIAEKIATDGSSYLVLGAT